MVWPLDHTTLRVPLESLGAGGIELSAFPHQVERTRALGRSEPVLRRGDILFCRARYALSLGLRALGRQGRGRNTVLLPAWHCKTQVQAAEAAGLRVRFFPLHADGSIDLGGLERTLDRDVLAVSVTHYYGWPARLDEVRRLIRPVDAMLVEDCAHALGSRAGGMAVGDSGALSIFSLHKSLPVADGGVLRVNATELSLPRPPPGGLGLRPLLGALNRSLGLAPLVRRLRGTSRDDCGERTAAATGPGPRFEPELCGRGATLVTAVLARWSSARELRQLRRANYCRLEGQLAGHPRFKPLHPQLAPGVSPLALVIQHRQRDRVEHELRQRGVETFAFGRDPHRSLDLSRHPGTRRLLEQTLALPVHQQLEPDELERVARTVWGVL